MQEKLDREQIEHLAKLARLEVHEDEKQKFETQLGSILEFIGVINEIDTSLVEPLEHVVPLHTVLRVDEVKVCSAETRDGIINGFPEKTDDLLKVPAVFL